MLALSTPSLLLLALSANHIPNAFALNRSVSVLPSSASVAVCPRLPILEVVVVCLFFHMQGHPVSTEKVELNPSAVYFTQDKGLHRLLEIVP